MDLETLNLRRKRWCLIYLFMLKLLEIEICKALNEIYFKILH